MMIDEELKQNERERRDMEALKAEYPDAGIALGGKWVSESLIPEEVLLRLFRPEDAEPEGELKVEQELLEQVRAWFRGLPQTSFRDPIHVLELQLTGSGSDVRVAAMERVMGPAYQAVGGFGEPEKQQTGSDDYEGPTKKPSIEALEELDVAKERAAQRKRIGEYIEKARASGDFAAIMKLEELFAKLT